MFFAIANYFVFRNLSLVAKYWLLFFIYISIDIQWGIIHNRKSLFLAHLLVLSPVLGLTFFAAIARASASRASDHNDNNNQIVSI